MTDPNVRIAQSWADNAQSWTTAVRSGTLESRRLVTDQAILDAVLNCDGARVLDVGCGEGWLSRCLSERGRELTGFDASAELIRAAQSKGGAQYIVLSYDEFAREPERVGRDYDIAVCNFSLLGDDIAPIVAALRQIASPSGHLLIQTVHPFAATAELPYADGWREETFEGLPGQWSPMPWYFRTIGSWIREVTSAGWHVQHCTEPLHPATGRPASLIFDATATGYAATHTRQ